MDINEIAKTMTREDFLKQTVKNESCPSDFGLNNDNCSEFVECNDCIKNMIKDIQFKDEEDENKDELSNNYKWVFNLKEFKKDMIAINCESQSEFDKLFDVLITNGMNLIKENCNYANPIYGKYTCYDYVPNTLEYSDSDYYCHNGYQVFKFSDIDFSQVWDKDSINEVALNNTNEENLLQIKCIDDVYASLTLNKYYTVIDEITTDYKIENDNGITMYYKKSRFELVKIKGLNEFNITQAKYITKEQMNTRGYITGDILFDGSSMAIVYGNKVLHMNDNCVESLIPKAFNYILPIELIERDLEIQKLLSGKLSGKVSQSYLIDFFIKVEEEPQLKTICSISFTTDSSHPKPFILEGNKDSVKVNDIIECNTGSAYQYGRVVGTETFELKEHEIDTYRTCRKLSD